MKHLQLLLLFLLFGFCAQAQFTKEEIKQVKRTLGARVGEISYKYDNHAGILWVHSGKVSLTGSSYFYLYYGLEKQGDSIVRKPLRIKARYHGSGWIFANNVSIALLKFKDQDKGQTNSGSSSDSNPSRNVYSGGYVEEIIDAVVSSDMLSVIAYVVANKRAISVRFDGNKKYSKQIALGGLVKKRLEHFLKKISVYPLG